MCGFVGIYDPYATFSPSERVSIVKSMGEELDHRGPDDTGNWGNEIVSLSHRRLSILDISKAGSQPMFSHCKRFIIAFNGEIYNHNTLREKLEKEYRQSCWRGNSDTETLLECLSNWGIEETLSSLEGMFSFALVDTFNNTLYLARDSFGEKPLYWGWIDKTIVFCSELQALNNHPFFVKSLSSPAVINYFQLGYIPSPWSIYSGIYKLPPSSWLEINGKIPVNPPNKPLTFSSNYDNIKLNKYNKINLNNVIQPRNILSDFDYINQVENNLRLSVQKQMVADVDVGAFLSGGIDSSLIVALMQQNSSKKINTFTLGFNSSFYNEANDAAEISKHLGTNHVEHYVDDSEIEKALGDIPRIYDEPFADSSQIPSFIISQLASKSVKVVLTGDGGDELFGGYPKYSYGSRQINIFSKLQYSTRKKIGASMINKLTYNDQIYKSVLSLPVPIRGSIFKLIYRSIRLADRLISVNNIEDLNIDMSRIWTQSDLLNIEKIDVNIWELDQSQLKNISNEQRMMLNDLQLFLIDDLICKMDRTSMANSVEVRMPFLDPNVVDIALSTPLHLKLNPSNTKIISKFILKKYLPEKYTLLPKKGFSIPLEHLLRNVLRDRVIDLVNSKNMHIINKYIPKNLIKQICEEHLNGYYNWSNKIWTLLVFDLWLDQNSVNT